jgi:hypothetical protein
MEGSSAIMIRGSLGGCLPKTAAHTAGSHRMTGLYTEHSQKIFLLLFFNMFVNPVMFYN